MTWGGGENSTASSYTPISQLQNIVSVLLVLSEQLCLVEALDSTRPLKGSGCIWHRGTSSGFFESSSDWVCSFRTCHRCLIRSSSLEFGCRVTSLLPYDGVWGSFLVFGCVVVWIWCALAWVQFWSEHDVSSFNTEIHAYAKTSHNLRTDPPSLFPGGVNNYSALLLRFAAQCRIIAF